MIFVTVGTMGFDELIKKVDELKEENKIKDNVLIQIGKSKYKPKNCECFRFKPSLEPYYNKADLVIAHGGAGTTFEVLQKGIKLLSVNNPYRTDQHQRELLKKLSEEGYLVWCRNLKILDEKIKETENKKLRRYKIKKHEIHKKIKNFLDD